jgi:hypothetical protein
MATSASCGGEATVNFTVSPSEPNSTVTLYFADPQNNKPTFTKLNGTALTTPSRSLTVSLGAATSFTAAIKCETKSGDPAMVCPTTYQILYDITADWHPGKRSGSVDFTCNNLPQNVFVQDSEWILGGNSSSLLRYGSSDSDPLVYNFSSYVGYINITQLGKSWGGGWGSGVFRVVIKSPTGANYTSSFNELGIWKVYAAADSRSSYDIMEYITAAVPYASETVIFASGSWKRVYTGMSNSTVTTNCPTKTASYEYDSCLSYAPGTPTTSITSNSICPPTFDSGAVSLSAGSSTFSISVTAPQPISGPQCGGAPYWCGTVPGYYMGSATLTANFTGRMQVNLQFDTATNPYLATSTGASLSCTWSSGSYNNSCEWTPPSCS